MTVTAPASATTGATGTITLTFSGLAPATKYLGSVEYSGTRGSAEPDDRPGRHAVGERHDRRKTRGRRSRPLVVVL